MNAKSALRWGATTLTLFATSAVAWAGSFGVSVDPASSQGKGLPKGTLFVAKPFGCVVTTETGLTATAEGIVKGERKSLPIQLTRIGPDSYAVRRQWPREGTWLLAFRVESPEKQGTSLVQVGKDGKIVATASLKMKTSGKNEPTYFVVQTVSKGVIDETLQSMDQSRSKAVKVSSAAPRS